MDQKKLGKRISILRKTKGLTQVELAEKLFVSDKAISRWEKGISMPDIETLIKMAQFFQVKIDDLLLEKEKAIQENEECHTEKNVDVFKYRKFINLTFISIGIFLSSVIISAIFHLIFNEIYITLCVLSLGFVATLLCQAIFSRNFIYYCNTNEKANERYKGKIQNIITLQVLLFSAYFSVLACLFLYKFLQIRYYAIIIIHACMLAYFFYWSFFLKKKEKELYDEQKYLKIKKARRNFFIILLLMAVMSIAFIIYINVITFKNTETISFSELYAMAESGEIEKIFLYENKSVAIAEDNVKYVFDFYYIYSSEVVEGLCSHTKVVYENYYETYNSCVFLTVVAWTTISTAAILLYQGIKRKITHSCTR